MCSQRAIHPDSPIGVFDSGLGGLTVVKQILRLMPGEDIVYLGDEARVPYGTKSPQTVREFALQDATFLLGFAPKLIVVACNTASALALDLLQERMPVGVVGVVEPAAREALRIAKGGTIGVIGTEGTIASKAYQRALGESAGGPHVVAAACHLLVHIVEEGRPETDPIVLHVLTDYLAGLQRARPAVLILGCTHYPLLAGAVQKLMGPGTTLLDPGVATALEVQTRLRDAGLLATRDAGTLRCFTSDNAPRFATVARRFLGAPVQEVTWVGTDELARPAETAAAVRVARPTGTCPYGKPCPYGHDATVIDGATPREPTA